MNGSGATLHATGNLFQGMLQGVFFEGDSGPSTISGNDFDGLLASDNGCGKPACGSLRFPEVVFLLADGGVTNTSLQSIQGNTFHNFAGQPIQFNATGAGSTFSNLEVVGNNINV